MTVVACLWISSGFPIMAYALWSLHCDARRNRKRGFNPEDEKWLDAGQFLSRRTEWMPSFFQKN